MNRRQQSKRRDRPNLIGPIHFSTDLLLTRLADHFYVRNLHVAMLSVALLHAAGLRSLFRVFLHVVHLRIRNDAGRGHRMTKMLGEIH